MARSRLRAHIGGPPRPQNRRRSSQCSPSRASAPHRLPSRPATPTGAGGKEEHSAAAARCAITESAARSGMVARVAICSASPTATASGSRGRPRCHDRRREQGLDADVHPSNVVNPAGGLAEGSQRREGALRPRHRRAGGEVERRPVDLDHPSAGIGDGRGMHGSIRRVGGNDLGNHRDGLPQDVAWQSSTCDPGIGPMVCSPTSVRRRAIALVAAPLRSSSRRSFGSRLARAGWRTAHSA